MLQRHGGQNQSLRDHELQSPYNKMGDTSPTRSFRETPDLGFGEFHQLVGHC